MGIFNLSIRMKLIGFTFLAITAVALIGWMGAREVAQNLTKQKHAELRSQVDVALSVVRHEIERLKKGEVSSSAVLKNAAEAVRPMRFSGNEYFFFYDMSGINLMHPFRRDFEGKDMSGLKDENGVLIIQEMMRVTQRGGSGLVEYLWKKPGSDTATLKVAFVAGVPELNLFVGTGVHVEDVDALIAEAKLRMIQNCLFVIGAIIALGITAMVGVTRPLRRLKESLSKLALGRFDVNIQGLTRKDELGDIARSVRDVQQLMQERATAEKTQLLESEKQAAQDRHSVLAGASERFDESIQTLAERLQSEALSLSATAEALSAESTSVDQSASAVSTTVTEVLDHIRTVASAIVELDANAQHSSERCNSVLTKMKGAAETTTQTRETIEALNVASADIGQVAALIQSIAEQTNLLALNATIEAARAGDAGRGFAVVASEVKQLATQTASATDDITQKITKIAEATLNAVKATNVIGVTIDELNLITNDIASAVQQQSAAAAEISRAVEIAASQTERVSKEMADVAGSAETTRKGATNVVETAKAFDLKATELREEAKRFTAFLSAA
jgi:methyl-accepting chemotaxis protein